MNLQSGYNSVLADLEELNSLLVGEDDHNMDTGWHYYELHLLLEAINYHFRERNDFYAGGNNFIYFSAEHVRNQDFRGPDFYFVDGVPRQPLRQWWCVWEENGKYPDLIIELLSPTTAAEDLGVKKDTYERIFRTGEYFCYDPDARLLQGWRLGSARVYEPIKANERGWMWCGSVGLWLGLWTGRYQGFEGTWLRFFDSHGNPVMTGQELAEAEKLHAEAAKLHAEAEKQRAELEKQRADTLAAEVARLRGLLENKKD
jgi:Uma2 family endonuclease